MDQKKPRIMRYAIILIAVVALAASLVVAYFVKETGEVVNDFTPAASVNPTVLEESFDGITKKNVKVNVGESDYSVYVRAAIVITWKDEDGIVYFAEPVKDQDYSIVLNSTDWKLESDGYYYCILPVDGGEDTPVLIESCTQLDTPIEGYTLSVDIIVQTVQAVGYTDLDENDPESTEIPAYKDAWGLS